MTAGQETERVYSYNPGARMGPRKLSKNAGDAGISSLARGCG